MYAYEVAMISVHICVCVYVCLAVFPFKFLKQHTNFHENLQDKVIGRQTKAFLSNYL